MDIFSLHQKFIECNQEISTDTRMLTAGSLFFAWKGEFVDGNSYAKEALEKGARYVVIDNPEYAEDSRYILVDNSIETLAELARYHRRQFDIPVIAIGGSNGKTTTKELTAEILRTQKDVVASFASENNHVGVPKTLLRITNATDIVVLEFGANHKGEIATLCKIAEPTIGLITNIGRDHIGLFGDQAAIIESNVELYDYLRLHNRYVLVNKNNMTLMKYAKGIDQTCYGEGVKNEFGGFSQKTIPYVSLKWKNYLIQSQLTGEYNIENIIAAISVGVYFDITENHIKNAIESYKPLNNRSELFITEKDNIVIKDFYNANSTSMEASLNNLKDLASTYSKKKSIAILGDMLELGEFSIDEHQSVVDTAQSFDFDEVVLIGPDFKQTNHNDCIHYDNVDEAIFDLQKQNFHDSVILLKASNGTNFKKIFKEIDW